MADEEDMKKEMEAVLAGEDYEPSYKPITTYTEGFQKFVEENAKGISDSLKAGTAPYFVVNNEEVVRRILKGEDLTRGNVDIPKELESGSKYLHGEKYEFSERFFELIDKSKPIALFIEGGRRASGSSFDGTEVYLSNGLRNDKSPWHRKSVVYHEYGHCIDAQRELWKSGELKKLYSKHKALLMGEASVGRASYIYAYSYYNGQRESPLVVTAQKIECEADYVDNRLYSLYVKALVSR